MKKLIILLFLFSIVACGVNKSNNISSKAAGKLPDFSSQVINNQNNISRDTLPKESDLEPPWEIRYVVIADTSPDYFYLREKMFALHNSLGLEIDTLGREYNFKKNLIAVPGSEEEGDDAGHYLFRRYDSESLSLEYLCFYKQENEMKNPEYGGSKTIALMTGVFTEKKEAERSLIIIKNIEKNAFLLPAKLYMGCMH
jgi:hypothetical protein